ncbi:MAG: four helix bundle protein [Puniceicoccaceae bacterium]
MPYDSFTEYPLWKEASALADSVFDFSREIEDFSIRNRMTGAAVDIPFRIGEAAQAESDEAMRDLLRKAEDPVNELRSVLTEAKEQGFAPGADYELMQERCRNFFHKIHLEASAPQPESATIRPAAPGGRPPPAEDPPGIDDSAVI